MICDLTLGLGKVTYDYLQSPASESGPKAERVIAGVK
jgi:hypothetical protein